MFSQPDSKSLGLSGVYNPSPAHRADPGHAECLLDSTQVTPHRPCREGVGMEEAFYMPLELSPLFLPYSNPRSLLALSGVGIRETTPTFSISEVQPSFLWAPPFYSRVDGTLIKVTYPQALGTQRGRFALKKNRRGARACRTESKCSLMLMLMKEMWRLGPTI